MMICVGNHRIEEILERHGVVGDVLENIMADYAALATRIDNRTLAVEVTASGKMSVDDDRIELKVSCSHTDHAYKTMGLLRKGTMRLEQLQEDYTTRAEAEAKDEQAKDLQPELPTSEPTSEEEEPDPPKPSHVVEANKVGELATKLVCAEGEFNPYTKFQIVELNPPDTIKIKEIPDVSTGTAQFQGDGKPFSVSVELFDEVFSIKGLEFTQ